MGVVALLCMLLLTEQASAEFIHIVTAAPVVVYSNQTASFSHTLQCDANTNVYVVSIRMDSEPSCNNGQPSRRSFSLTLADLDEFTGPCRTNSTCTVSFSIFLFNCATFTYVCVAADPALAIDSESSVSGTSLTAGYSAAGNTASGRNTSWVCSVEASDCSRVNVTLLLVIRNGNNQAFSFFSVPGHLWRLGWSGLRYTQGTLLTPFNVRLNVISGSLLQNAYAAVSARENITMTCGRRSTVPPDVHCSVPIMSEHRRRRFGHALTAAYSSSGGRVAENSTWECEVEAADCSSSVNMSVSVFISSWSSPRSYFSRNGANLRNRAVAAFKTPFVFALHLIQGSYVYTAYISVRAASIITVACGPSPSSRYCDQCATSPCQEGFQCENLPGSFLCRPCPQGFQSTADGRSCVDMDECARDSSPCDVTARCNNTEGSFHCYCDFGFLLTENSTACVDVDECDRDPHPCDVTARCNNTEGSFHCYCDPGFLLTDQSTACVDSSVASPAEQPQPRSQTSVVGPAVGGAVAALVVIAVVVIIIVVFVWRSRAAKKAAGGESVKGRLSGGQAERDNIGLNDVIRGRSGEAHNMHDYLNVMPEPQPAAGSASTAARADQPYEPLDPAFRHHVNSASPYQALGPAAVPGDNNTAYESLNTGSRNDVSMTSPYEVIMPPAISGDNNAAYEPLDPDSRDHVDTAALYQALGPAVTSGDVNTAYELLDQGTRDDVSASAPYAALHVMTTDN